MTDRQSWLNGLTDLTLWHLPSTVESYLSYQKIHWYWIQCWITKIEEACHIILPLSSPHLQSHISLRSIWILTSHLNLNLTLILPSWSFLITILKHSFFITLHVMHHIHVILILITLKILDVGYNLQISCYIITSILFYHLGPNVIIISDIKIRTLSIQWVSLGGRTAYWSRNGWMLLSSCRAEPQRISLLPSSKVFYSLPQLVNFIQEV